MQPCIGPGRSSYRLATTLALGLLAICSGRVRTGRGVGICRKCMVILGGRVQRVVAVVVVVPLSRVLLTLILLLLMAGRRR